MNIKKQQVSTKTIFEKIPGKLEYVVQKEGVLYKCLEGRLLVPLYDDEEQMLEIQH